MIHVQTEDFFIDPNPGAVVTYRNSRMPLCLETKTSPPSSSYMERKTTFLGSGRLDAAYGFAPPGRRRVKLRPNPRKGIFLGFLSKSTAKNILWYDVEMSKVKIAKHARSTIYRSVKHPPMFHICSAYSRVNPFPLNLMIHPSMNSRLLSTPLLTP
jgi:hypothetical protein